ncbi:MAG: hypothetical protein RR841_09420, partial [Eubacterium sp.]
LGSLEKNALPDKSVKVYATYLESSQSNRLKDHLKPHFLKICQVFYAEKMYQFGGRNGIRNTKYNEGL